MSQTSPVLDLSNVLVSEWGANRSLQNLVESLKPEEWRLLPKQIKARGFGTTCSNIIYGSKSSVSTNVRPYCTYGVFVFNKPALGIPATL